MEVRLEVVESGTDSETGTGQRIVARLGTQEGAVLICPPACLYVSKSAL